MLSMAGSTEALALRADVGVLGGVGMALRAVGLRRVQRGDNFRRVLAKRHGLSWTIQSGNCLTTTYMPR
jgi:hypothetical protein